MQLADNIFEEYWEPVVKTSLTVDEERSLSLDETINNKNIDHSCRYFLKQRRMPKDQLEIGRREMGTATHCFLCNEAFLEGDKKVIDHDRFTGKYFGIAHNKCNLQRKTKAEIVVFMHNANYDFVELLPKFFIDYGVEIEPTGIPKRGEKLMTLTMNLSIAKEVHQKKSGAKKELKDFIFRIRFKESFSFLGASLEKVMENFSVEKLKNLRQEFPKDEDFELVRKKLPFPYGYMKGESFLLKPLPGQCKCFDALSCKIMDDEDYNRLEKIYNFVSKNMKKLQEIYLKTDCVLLSDAMKANSS